MITNLKGAQVKVGIQAPREVGVLRKELSAADHQRRPGVLSKYDLGVLGGDQGRMRVFRDDPFRTRAAFDASFVAGPLRGFIMHVPNGVLRVGQGVPFKSDGAIPRYTQVELVEHAFSRRARGTHLEVSGDDR